MFCEHRVEQTPSEHAGQTVHMQIICTAYAQQVWQFLDSLDMVCECCRVHLPSVQSTHPEFLDVQQSKYLKGLMGMWKFWISICTTEISSQANSQVEKDKMSKEIGTWKLTVLKKKGWFTCSTCAETIHISSDLCCSALPSTFLLIECPGCSKTCTCVSALLPWTCMAFCACLCTHILSHNV